MSVISKLNVGNRYMSKVVLPSDGYYSSIINRNNTVKENFHLCIGVLSGRGSNILLHRHKWNFTTALSAMATI